MIQKNKNSESIDFLFGVVTGGKQEEVVEDKDTKPEVKIEKAKKLDNNEAVASRFSNAILSAGQGNITNMGGPQKQMGSETNNSIWDSGILEKLAGTPSNKEKTIESKEEIENLRNSMKSGRIDEMVEALKETDQRKDATVTGMSEYTERDARTYQLPSRNISIFDTKEEMDFRRVPEKTAGELSVEEAGIPKEKDESWKDIKGAPRLKNTLDTLFDNLTKEDDQNQQ
jgi:hypothetical protein